MRLVLAREAVLMLLLFHGDLTATILRPVDYHRHKQYACQSSDQPQGFVLQAGLGDGVRYAVTMTMLVVAVLVPVTVAAVLVVIVTVCLRHCESSFPDCFLLCLAQRPQQEVKQTQRRYAAEDNKRVPLPSAVFGVAHKLASTDRSKG